MLSWHLLSAPSSTEDIKLSAPLATRNRRTDLDLQLPRGEMCACPTSLETDEPNRGLGGETSSLMALLVLWVPTEWTPASLLLLILTSTCVVQKAMGDKFSAPSRNL